MKKLSLMSAVSAAVALASSQAMAEKCTVTDPNDPSKGLIKAGKGACDTSLHDCDGLNPAGEAEAWIKVDKETCDKLQRGDFDNVPDDVRDLIDIPS